MDREQTTSFGIRKPLIMAIERIARITSGTVDIIEGLGEKLGLVQAPKVIMEVGLNSVRVMTIVGLLGGCTTITHKLGNGVNVTGDFVELSTKCENSVDSWNSFGKSVKEQLNEKVNSYSGLDSNIKKRLLQLIKGGNIPENIKVKYCLDEITDLKAEYNAFYAFSLTLHLKTDVNQRNVQHVTANFNKGSKTLHKIVLKPRIIGGEEVRTASNF